MNNPLSIISGRAQFLARTEIDAERKRTLALIQKNADDLSAMIDGLMSFASPATPKALPADIARIIEEASALAMRKTGAESVNLNTEVPGSVTVIVDSGQTVSAIANIITNAIESYEQPGGPIMISASANEKTVELKIADKGRGMNPEILQKATCPFFSARPAGRKHGMGLAHARRLIELNNGTLRIESSPKAGTTVTVSLPRK
jgi:two-component system sporulation sensor kinase B